MPKRFSTGLVWIWIAAAVILIDRASKIWVMHHLMPYQAWEILPVFDLTLAYNTGAAFGFLHSASGWQNILFGGLAFIVSIIIIVTLIKSSARAIWTNIAMCMILGGALGNVWDRLQYQYVIDFLAFHLGEWRFAIFNLADSAIFVGAVMLIIYWVFLVPRAK